MDAKTMLTVLRDRLDPDSHHAEKKAATLRALDEFCQLAESADLAVSMKEIQVWILSSTNRVRFALNEDGGIDWAAGSSNDWETIPLIFRAPKEENEVGRWESEEPDPDRAPVPGEVLPRKTVHQVMAEITARVLLGT